MEKNNNQPRSRDVASRMSQGEASTSGPSGSGRLAYPPGYRFVPTDQELILEYLVKKVNNEPIPVVEMCDVKLYEHPPYYLLEHYPQLGDKEWYFFTPRDRKYPNGSRPSRSVGDVGYWKATGADKQIKSIRGEEIGKRQALVFYLGKPKPGKSKKTRWIMHEYKLKGPSISPRSKGMRLDDWVLCRIYEKPTKSDKKQKDDAVDDDRVPRDDDDDVTIENIENENENAKHLAALHIHENNNGDDAANRNHHINGNNNNIVINQNHYIQENNNEDVAVNQNHHIYGNSNDIVFDQNHYIHENNNGAIAIGQNHYHELDDDQMMMIINSMGDNNSNIYNHHHHQFQPNYQDGTHVLADPTVAAGPLHHDMNFYAPNNFGYGALHDHQQQFYNSQQPLWGSNIQHMDHQGTRIYGTNHDLQQGYNLTSDFSNDNFFSDCLKYFKYEEGSSNNGVMMMSPDSETSAPRKNEKKKF